MVGTGKDTQTTQAQTHTNDYGGPTISGFSKKYGRRKEVMHMLHSLYIVYNINNTFWIPIYW